MNSLSVCLITKDEEHNIGDCLDSIREIVDEMILVDTGSHDNTIAIAAGRGAKVFELPWRDNFAAAKNETLRHATGDWILAMDADERLSSVSRNKIRQLLIDPTYQAYMLQLRCPYKQGNSIQGISTGLAIRLFKNNIGLRYHGRIHERICTSTRRGKILVANTNIIIDHLGYQDNLEAKYLRNLSLAGRQKTKHDAFSRYDMARMLTGLGQYAEAARQLQRGMEFTGAAAWLRGQMYVLHGDLLMYVNGDNAEACASWHQAMDIEPKMVAPRLRMGRYYYHLGDFKAASSQFESIVELLSLGSLRGVASDDECTLAEAYASLAACYARSGHREEAADAVVKSRMPVADDETVRFIPWNSDYR